jgi:orotidine-5'-phosphate decarboxylase
MSSFPQRLADAVARVGSPLCVGIDPWPDRLPGSGAPAERAARFGRAVVEACRGRVAAVKPQFAFFEALGPDGMRALADTCVAAREAGLLVIGDAKRGDIGSTAAAYASATLSPDAPFPCDALTVSPFLGADTLEPFLDSADRHGRGLFVLTRTSNPGSALFQGPVEEALTGWLNAQGVARAGTDGLSCVGAVVGATHADVLQRLRARLPHAWLLVPGYGAQGASAAETRAAARADGTGALIVSARAATFPPGGFGADPVEDVARLVEAARQDLATAWAGAGQ